MKTSKWPGTGILVLGLLLGLHDGRIALWRSGCCVPLQIYPYAAATLPEQEQKLLELGIPVRDSEHLHRLLEDYLS